MKSYQDFKFKRCIQEELYQELKEKLTDSEEDKWKRVEFLEEMFKGGNQFMRDMVKDEV